MTDHAAFSVADLTRDTSIEAMAERVIADAPSSFDVVGFSMGGIVALEIERRAPGRVRGMALINTNPRADAQTDRNALVQRARNGELLQIAASLADRYFYSEHSELKSLVVEMARNLGAEVFARQNAALAGRRDSTSQLSAIQTQTIIICGHDDQIVPMSVGRAMAAAIPGAQFRGVAKCGHMATLEQPSEIANALNEWFSAL